ncbi:MAG TPA: hypothetical protein VGD22_05935, partial [Sphingobacteriaceae bacterium]
MLKLIKSIHTCIFLMSLTILSPWPASGQGTCKVLLPAISANYEGHCKKGLAEGTGTAKGTDEYTGSFKKGLPDGNGKYTWKSGNIYDGGWIKGEMNGKGTFYYKRPGKKDSVVAGTWENNTLQKQSKEAFIIHLKSAHVTEVDVKRRKSSNNNVSINLTNSNSGATFSTNPSGDQANWQQIPPPQLTDITVLEGLYDNIQKNK